GSLRVDVKTTVNVTLTNTDMTKIPTMAYGPLFKTDNSLGGLLVGRSSAGIRELIVIPEVIDADYTRQIQIMTYTLCPPMFIPKENKIAQIVALLNQQPAAHISFDGDIPQFQGDGNFGSTGPAVCFTTTIDQQPTMKVILQKGNQEKAMLAMLDTGMDITIIN
ncbi:POK9 protein, partial [Eurystomus gularis]|nr:POK9 protein [Eurystomus gularis]